MSKNKVPILLTIAVLVISLLVGLSAQPAYSEEPPSWAMKIMKNITITGLINPGEEQEVHYLGKGSWSNSVNDVHYFLVYRMLQLDGGWRRDLQAHIELAKKSNGNYTMEIYHSWLTLVVSVPYPYTVVLEEPHLLVLEIKADL